MNFQNEIFQLQKEIDKRLKIFFDRKIKEAKKIFPPLVGKITSDIGEFILRGGKRIRPILFYYGYLAAGGKNKKEILDTSIFIELIHSYLLIHDDIMDRDEFRRGKPTIHQKYKENYRWNEDASHLGVSAGIGIGDLASVFGYEILTESKFPEAFKIKAVEKLNQVLIDVGIGQILDVFLKINHQLSQKEIFKILEYKTAKYTIEGPLHLGAILAGADEKILKNLSECAIPLGIAFQIQDDILGIFGDEKKLGKPVGSDLKEGKQTILIFKARKSASEKERKIIDQTLGNPNLTKNQLERVRKIIIKTGSLDFAKNLAKKLVLQAKNSIEKSNFSQKVKEFLLKLAGFIIEREK